MSGDRGYIDWRPSGKTKRKLAVVNDVLETYREHLPLTLRQIFYILVARMVIEKTKKEYANLSYMLCKARRARLIPFAQIHDQGSTLPGTLMGYDRPEHLSWLLKYQVGNFQLDRNLGQQRRLVICCEAAGMLAQMQRAGAPFGVHAFAAGGFDSVSDKYALAELVREARCPVRVLHVGDLDRHGEWIFDVLADDVRAFGADVDFVRLAVTEQQVHDLGLVSSAEDELVVQAESIPPDVLAAIVTDAIESNLDLDVMAEVAERSAAIRADFEDRMRSAGLWQ